MRTVAVADAELATAVLRREREGLTTERKRERSPCMLVCFISHSGPNITRKMYVEMRVMLSIACILYLVLKYLISLETNPL